MPHPALTFDLVISKTPAQVRLMVISRLVKYHKCATDHQRQRVLADMEVINQCGKFTNREGLEILAEQPEPIRDSWSYENGAFHVMLQDSSVTGCPAGADTESDESDPFITRLDAAIHQAKQLSHSLAQLRREYRGVPKRETQSTNQAQAHAETMRESIRALQQEQCTLSVMADALNEQGFRTQTGILLGKVQVSRIVQRLENG